MKTITVIKALCLCVVTLTAANPVWQRVADFRYSRIAATSNGFIASNYNALYHTGMSLQSWKKIDSISRFDDEKGVTHDPYFSAITSFADTVHISVSDPFIPWGGFFYRSGSRTFFADQLVKYDNMAPNASALYWQRDTILIINSDEGFENLLQSYSGVAGAMIELTTKNFGKVSDLTLINGDIVMLTSRSGMIRSSDRGQTWATDTSLRFAKCFFKHDDILYAGTYDSAKVFSSTDGGKTWTDLGFRGSGLKNLTAHNGMLYVAADSSLYATSLPVSVPHVIAEPVLRITPNPASYFMRILCEGCSDISICSALGIQIASFISSDTVQDIDIRSMPVGFYFVSVRGWSGTQTRALCVSR